MVRNLWRKKATDFSVGDLSLRSLLHVILPVMHFALCAREKTEEYKNQGFILAPVMIDLIFVQLLIH